MAVVYSDIIESTTVQRDANGYAIVRVFVLDGVQGNPTDIAFQALNTPPVPLHGEPHPTISGHVCDSALAEALSPSQVRVTCTYKLLSTQVIPDERQPAQISIGASVQTKQTSYDVNGKVITLKHTFTDTVNGVETTSVKEQTGEVEIQVPQMVVRYSRRETQAPLDKALLFIDTVNSSTFLGDPPGYWLCTRLEGTSSDGGKTWQVEYEFQRDSRNQWKSTVVYIDPDTNQPVVPDGNGEDVKTIDVYPPADFNQLSL
jgi:hypothetical protein